MVSLRLNLVWAWSRLSLRGFVNSCSTPLSGSHKSLQKKKKTRWSHRKINKNNMYLLINQRKLTMPEIKIRNIKSARHSQEDELIEGPTTRSNGCEHVKRRTRWLKIGSLLTGGWRNHNNAIPSNHHQVWPSMFTTHRTQKGRRLALRIAHALGKIDLKYKQPSQDRSRWNWALRVATFLPSFLCLGHVERIIRRLQSEGRALKEEVDAQDDSPQLYVCRTWLDNPLVHKRNKQVNQIPLRPAPPSH